MRAARRFLTESIHYFEWNSFIEFLFWYTNTTIPLIESSKMSTILNFSDAVSLALHSMGIMAGKKDCFFRTGAIAKQLAVSEHHLQKVHQRLSKAGLLHSARGPKGGFSLNKPAEEITLLEIVEAIEGPFDPSPCFLNKSPCPDCASSKI